MKNYSNYNDNDLFDLLKESNSRALKVLFERYFIKLCEFSNFYVKNITLAEEVVADVFFNIWIHREKIKIKTNLKAYLFTSVRNRSINCIVKERKNKEIFENLDQQLNLISDDSPTVDLSLMELENAIESLIQKLPPKRQLIFRMHRIYGLKHKEISELLSISVNTVQNHMVKAIEFLTKHYSKIKSFYMFLFFILLK